MVKGRVRDVPPGSKLPKSQKSDDIDGLAKSPDSLQGEYRRSRLRERSGEAGTPVALDGHREHSGLRDRSGSLPDRLSKLEDGSPFGIRDAVSESAHQQHRDGPHVPGAVDDHDALTLRAGLLADLFDHAKQVRVSLIDHQVLKTSQSIAAEDLFACGQIVGLEVRRQQTPRPKEVQEGTDQGHHQVEKHSLTEWEAPPSCVELFTADVGLDHRGVESPGVCKSGSR